MNGTILCQTRFLHDFEFTNQLLGRTFDGPYPAPSSLTDNTLQDFTKPKAHRDLFSRRSSLFSNERGEVWNISDFTFFITHNLKANILDFPTKHFTDTKTRFPHSRKKVD